MPYCSQAIALLFYHLPPCSDLLNLILGEHPLTPSECERHISTFPKVKLRLLSEPNKFRPCQLIVFEEFLMVFDTVDHKDSGELFDFKQGPDSMEKLAGASALKILF